MLPANGEWTDERAEKFIGGLLLVGVISSAIIVSISGAMYLVRYGARPPAYHVFRGEPQYLRSVHGVLRSARHLGRRGLIQLGLLVL
ncbi:MAG TPA: DUF1634 domain-containing protein, partial [Chthonomonadales bacterium]|nr:DUF1634 domain-containing protein [Chthonomonadales bacterium]